MRVVLGTSLVRSLTGYFVHCDLGGRPTKEQGSQKCCPKSLFASGQGKEIVGYYYEVMDRNKKPFALQFVRPKNKSDSTIYGGMLSFDRMDDHIAKFFVSDGF